MKQRVLIVDGHSVIFRWEDLREKHQRSTATTREELIRLLTRFQDNTGTHVVVVFDGRGSKTTQEDEPGGIQIFYSRAGQTADSVIERLVAKYAQNFEICVATDDTMERTTVSSFGARWINTVQLRAEMDEANSDIRDRLKNLHRR